MGKDIKEGRYSTQDKLASAAKYYDSKKTAKFTGRSLVSDVALLFGLKPRMFQNYLEDIGLLPKKPELIYNDEEMDDDNILASALEKGADLAGGLLADQLSKGKSTLAVSLQDDEMSEKKSCGKKKKAVGAGMYGVNAGYSGNGAAGSAGVAAGDGGVGENIEENDVLTNLVSVPGYGKITLTQLKNKVINHLEDALTRAKNGEYKEVSHHINSSPLGVFAKTLSELQNEDQVDEKWSLFDSLSSDEQDILSKALIGDAGLPENSTVFEKLLSHYLAINEMPEKGTDMELWILDNVDRDIDEGVLHKINGGKRRIRRKVNKTQRD